MNFVDLRTFLNVAESSSFSVAAQQLHVTQPAVSKRIQALEHSLGMTLFDRVGKRVYLTQAGRILVPQAQQMLTMLADTERQLRDLSDHITGSLKVATSHHIGLHRLAPVLRAFSAAYPEVQLNMTFEDSEVAHDMVRQGEIELAVVTLNPKGDSQLAYTDIWHDPLVFVGDEPRACSMVDLANSPCVLPGDATFTGRIVLERFAAEGIELSPGMSTNYLETLGMLVSVGLGWSVLPKSMAAELAILDVACAPMARTLGCVTNPARGQSNAARAFMEILKGYADH